MHWVLCSGFFVATFAPNIPVMVIFYSLVGKVIETQLFQMKSSDWWDRIGADVCACRCISW